jgi:hypothetical protein
VAFLCANFANVALTPHKRLAILLALFDAGVAIELGLMSYETTVLHYCLGNGSLACESNA